MNLPINQFKGLYTDVDPADGDLQHFTKWKDIKLFPGYAKGEGYDFEEGGYPNLGGKIVYYNFIFLDTDKLKNEFVNNQLKRTYVQDVNKYEFIITYIASEALYQFYSRKTGDETWILVEGTHSSDKEQIPRVVNENNILKIFFEEKAYWLGILDRTRWNLNGQYKIENKIYLKELIYNLIVDSTAILIKKFDSGTIEIEDPIDISRWEVENKEHPQGFGLQHRIAFYFINDDGEEELIRFNTNDGYLWIFHTRHEFSPNTIGYFRVIRNEDYDKLEPGNSNIVPFTAFPLEITGLLGGHFGDFPINTVRGVESEIGSENSPLPIEFVNWFNQVRDNGSYRRVIKISDEGIPEDSPHVEIIITAYTNQNEFAIRYIEKDFDVDSKFVVEFTTIASQFFPDLRVEALVFYARYATNKTEAKKKDFEQFGTLALLSKEKPYFPIILSVLSQNGIFLAQTIGKAVDPDTYEIIDNPDDYVTVGGISYALKGDNIHFPAVGGGNVLNNVFYLENFIPGVTGNFLVNYVNALGIYKKDQELLTIVDFQPIEGTMLFYIKDTIGYRIKDYRDIIKTADGTFLFMREGIYLTTQRNNVFLSQPINDIVEKAWDNGSGRIFYNPHLKELYFLTFERTYYVYRFKTKDWSQFTLPETVPPLHLPNNQVSIPLSDEIYTEIVHDYAGNVYFLSENKKDKLLTGIAKQGLFRTMDIGAADLSIKKILNHIKFDVDGDIVSPVETYISDGRGTVTIYNKLRTRTAQDKVFVELGFNGTLYGMQIDMEGISIERN